MPTINLWMGPRHYQFEDGDKSLLDHALEGGVPVNYSCKRGDCGQCLGKLVAGSVLPVSAAQPLYVNDNIYLCNARACTDVNLELPYFPELESIRTLRSPAKIHGLRSCSKDVIEMTLRLPPNVDFRFLPGQFIRLTNKDQITRSYSLATGPNSNKLLHVQIRKVAGGAFSDYLFNLAKLGDLLHLEGPQGSFFLRNSDNSTKTLFLATGTGIAPIFAILSSLPPSQRTELGELYLYWGNRFRDDEYLARELQSLTQSAEVHYWPLYSREGNGPRYIHQLLAQHHLDLSTSTIFACGSSAMIDSARRLTASLGLPADRFRSDPFTSS